MVSQTMYLHDSARGTFVMRLALLCPSKIIVVAVYFREAGPRDSQVSLSRRSQHGARI